MSESRDRVATASHELEETDTVSVSLDDIKHSMDGFGLSMHHIQWLIAEVERVKRWKEVILDACTVSFILKKEHEQDPQLAVNDLCQWVHNAALDPAISSSAKALHDSIADLKAANERLSTSYLLACSECKQLNFLDDCHNASMKAAIDCIQIVRHTAAFDERQANLKSDIIATIKEAFGLEQEDIEGGK